MLCSTLGELPLFVVVTGDADGSFQTGRLGQQVSKSMTKMLGKKKHGGIVLPTGTYFFLVLGLGLCFYLCAVLALE